MWTNHAFACTPSRIRMHACTHSHARNSHAFTQLHPRIRACTHSRVHAQDHGDHGTRGNHAKFMNVMQNDG
eukprot:gene22082-biopygen20708